MCGLPTKWKRRGRSRRSLERVVYWGSGKADSLETLMAKPGYERFEACDTASDDVCLIAFTSGTTGVPKGTMHFHRDMLAICDTFGKYVLRATRDDRFIGSPPIAFTFGLGGLVLFPLRIGAAAILLEKAVARRSSSGHSQNFAPPSASPRRLLIATCSASCRTTTSRRSANASRPARPCPLPRLRLGWRRPASALSMALARPKCCTCSSVRAKRRCDRARPASRCPATKRALSMRTDAKCRPARRDGWLCAARPDAAILATSGRRSTYNTAGISPATPTSRTLRAISDIRRAPTT